jgi:hypothetical protein
MYATVIDETTPTRPYVWSGRVASPDAARLSITTLARRRPLGCRDRTHKVRSRLVTAITWWPSAVVSRASSMVGSLTLGEDDHEWVRRLDLDQRVPAGGGRIPFQRRSVSTAIVGTSDMLSPVPSYTRTRLETYRGPECVVRILPRLWPRL